MKNYKRRLLILCIMCIASISLVQGQKDTTKSKEPVVHIKFFFGPSYPIILMPSKTLDYWHGGGDGGTSYKCSSNDLAGKFSTETGLLMDIRLNKKLFLSFGVTFDYISIQTRKNTLFNATSNNGFPPYTWTFTTNNVEVDQTYKFISTPISINYKLKNKKITSSLGIGISFDKLIGYEDLVIANGGTMYGDYVDLSQLFQKYYISLFTNAEFDYVIEKHLSVGVAPYLKYFFYNSPDISRIENSNELKFLLIGAKLFIKF